MSLIKEFEDLRIPLDAIKLATNNFDGKNLINKGRFGMVYKGEILHRGKLVMVVVKRLDPRFGPGTPEFLKEIMFLSRYRHENLVSLLGFCDQGRERILVYEYLSNKSLDLHLNDPNLSWVKRLKICIGVARGIEYLHNPSETMQRAIHRDIKSSNILLDENWNAKISDFGLSKFGPANKQSTFIVSNAVNSLGYTDSLYVETGLLTKESDIYSFGVVLFEVLCGRPTIIINNDGTRVLSLLAQKCYEQKKIGTIVPDFLLEQIVPMCLQRYADIAYQCLRKKRNERPLAANILEQLETALEDQIKELPKIRLENILSATNNFSDENLIKAGELGKLYRGRLFQYGKFMDIAARRLNRKHGLRDVMFQTEISMFSNFHHENIISIVGYVDEKDEKIVIYGLAVHGILEHHVSDPTLNWSQRLQICLGVARALNHIHYDVIHCDINSSKIFLDEDCEPKIYGFEFFTKYPQSWRHSLLCSSRFPASSMTPKFDIYCFGELMFEILCGRKPSIEDVVKEKVDGLIHPEVRKQMDTQSLTGFLKTAKTCLKKEPAERPTMDQIIKELGETLELQRNHENLEHSAAAGEDASTRRSKMDILKIALSEIKLATHEFQKGFVGKGGYGEVYRAELDVLDIQDMSSIEGKCKDTLPKISKNH